MALFDSQVKKTPLGVELIRRGLIKDSDMKLLIFKSKILV